MGDCGGLWGFANLEVRDFGTLGHWDSFGLWDLGRLNVLTFSLFDFGTLRLWDFGTFGILDLWAFELRNLAFFNTLYAKSNFLTSEHGRNNF